MWMFALVQGLALGPTPRECLLLHSATHARFFVGLPVLAIAEDRIGSRLRAAGFQFVRDGLVRPDDYSGFERTIAKIAP